MRRPSVDHITARFRLIDIVIAKQTELIEQHQQARRIAAAVDAVKLVGVVHIFHAGPCHMVCRARSRTDTLVKPRAGSGHSLALSSCRETTCRQKLCKLGAIARSQVNFNAKFASETVADEHSSRARRSDGIFSESRRPHAGPRRTGRDRTARHKRSTAGNIKRYFQMHPEPLTAIAARSP